jgi:hypothetical protein
MRRVIEELKGITPVRFYGEDIAWSSWDNLLMSHNVYLRASNNLGDVEARMCKEIY